MVGDLFSLFLTLLKSHVLPIYVKDNAYSQGSIETSLFLQD